jgi:hypothetical protein
MIKQQSMVGAVDMTKARTKWKQIVEKLGVTDPAKIDSLCEYAELHSTSLQAQNVNENAMYANPANTAGMGAVAFPGLSGVPGVPGTAGSGDLGQTLLPASLKIAAHTPGMDLVPNINVNSNRVDLLYFDWKYDDTNTGASDDERGTVFKLELSDPANQQTLIDNLRLEMAANQITELRGRISAPIYYNFVAGTMSLTAPVGSKAGWLQFKGFSRIDGLPMFRAYTQDNTASSGAWTFDPALNTFIASGSIISLLDTANGGAVGTGALFVNGVSVPITVASNGNALPNVSAVSLNEDFIDDFTTNRHKEAMTRGEWDVTTAGKIGPDSFVASVEIGVAHVSASLRLSEIGDWKRMYGVDVIEKTKAQLVTQISQKISTEIVDKVKELGLRNRQSAPAATVAMPGIANAKIFDMSTVTFAANLNGENTNSIARKVWSKIQQASYYINTDGRIGEADYLIASGSMIGVLKSIENYTINPIGAKMALPGQLHPAGVIDGMKLYVDPYMAPNDLNVYLGRVGTQETPGLKMFSYMLAETVEIVSERTMASHMYMYSRYAIAEFGFFPEKQYYAIEVADTIGAIV